MSQQEFLILSIKHTRGGVMTWWGPDNKGYSVDLSKAGRYSRQQVEAARSYYDDGVDSLAVPVAAAYALAETFVFVGQGESNLGFLRAVRAAAFPPEKAA